jgi:DNA-binding NtrC family response regulator
MEAFLVRCLPGTSPAIARLREQILEFAASPTVRSLLIRGPIGAGKSTLARVAGLLRRVAPLSEEEAKLILDSTKFTADRQIDPRSLVTWYVELSLTGLVENLAEAQLFGTVKGAFTGATASPGVFERAAQGIQGERAVGAEVTGGIVFLDEIGDLAPTLQSKLLPIFSGGTYYRLGSEGRNNADLSFSGVVITASWRELDRGLVRPDLLSRISGCVVDLPGIDDRKEDFKSIVEDLQQTLINRFRGEIERLLVVEPKMARDYWIKRATALGPMSGSDLEQLATVDWNRHGNFRGLRAAVERIVVGSRSSQQVLAELPRTDGGAAEYAETDLLGGILERSPDGESLIAHVRAIELLQRRELRRSLLGDSAMLARVASGLGIEPGQLKLQLRHIDRERRVAGRGGA